MYMNFSKIKTTKGTFKKIKKPYLTLEYLKGISIEKTYIGKLSRTIRITFSQKIWRLNRDRFLSQLSLTRL
jgi:hypothetical protein